MTNLLFGLMLLSSFVFAGSGIINKRTGESIVKECIDIECTLFDIFHLTSDGESNELIRNLNIRQLQREIEDRADLSLGYAYIMSTKIRYEMNPLVAYTLYSFFTIPVFLIESVEAGVMEIKQVDNNIKMKKNKKVLDAMNEDKIIEVSSKRFKSIFKFFSEI